MTVDPTWIPTNQNRPGEPSTDRKRSRLRLGITGLLYLVLVAVGLAPLLVVGTLMVNTAVTSMHRAVRELQLAVVSDVTHAVRREVTLGKLELNTVADLLLGDGYGDDARRIDLASARLSASERLEWISVFSPDGELVGTLKTATAHAPPRTQHLRPSLSEQLQAESGTAVGEVTDGGGYPVLELATSVVVDGQTRGVVVGGLALNSLCALLEDVSSRRFAGERSVVYVVDSDTRLVAHPECRRAALREQRRARGIFRAVTGTPTFSVPFGLSPEFTDDAGKAWLGALESLPELGWAVVVELDRDIAYGPIVQMKRTMVVGGVATTMGLLVLAVWVARWFTRPIRQLETATRHVARRDFDHRVPVLRNDEIGALAQAFNDMAASLQRSEERLLAETRIRNDLSRYLSPEVVEEIIHHPDRMKLGGERRTVTVLFADIVGFTSLAERLRPEEVVAILNELFTFATEIILRRGGTIDKFIGDCIMAVFGAPSSAPDDAVRAVQAAEDLMRWIDVGNRRWRKAYDIELQLAIGINTGPVVAGNVGSEKRMEYTVIGDTVNVAARLEALAGPGQILLSHSTREAIGEAFPCEPAGTQELMGRTGTTMTFTISVEK